MSSVATGFLIAPLPFDGMEADSAKKKRGPVEGYVRMTFDMPSELRHRLRVAAAQMDKRINSLLLEWTKRGVEEAERRPPRAPRHKQP